MSKLTVGELIQILEEYAEDLEVVFVTQQNYPMKGFFAAIGVYQEMKRQQHGNLELLEGRVELLEYDIEQAESLPEEKQPDMDLLYLKLEEAEDDVNDYIAEFGEDEQPNNQIVIAIHENREYADSIERLTWEHGERMW